MKEPISYEQRIAQQIAQYTDTINIHDLPESFHFWSHNYIRPGLERVFGVSSIPEFYANAVVRSKTSNSGCKRVLSIGSGDGIVEISMAEKLIDNGITDFEIIATDISDVLLGRMTENVKKKNLEKYIIPQRVDLNKIGLDGYFDTMMAHHSLHHIVELEILFNYCKEHLLDGGVFATNDMIGRNGHRRWPETAFILRHLWPTLSEGKRYNAQLKTLNEKFTDHDCSVDGFEGIRAQDILPLLIERFEPRRFFGTGGFIDLLVDRGYGQSWDMSDEVDISTLKFLAELNEILLDTGVVKPTIMMAYFMKEPGQEICYRSRNSRSCLRIEEPHWLCYRKAVVDNK